MYRFKKLYTVITALIAAALLMPLAVYGQKPASPKVVAEVNGSAIAYDDYESELEMYKSRMKSQGIPMSGQFESKIRTDVLAELVNRELLFQESQQKGMKIDTQLVDKEFNAIKQRYPDKKEFETILKNMKLTEESLKAKIGRQSAIRALVDQEIISKIKITESATKAFYDDNPSQFMRPEEVHARHILIKIEKDASEEQKAEARKKLTDIKKRSDGGEDFAQLAKQYSQGPSGPKGGDLGYFSKGKMVPPFEKAAYSLKPGEVSDIVETRFGYHLIKVEDHRDAHTLAYDEVKPKIQGKLRNDEIRKQVSDYVAKLRESAKIKTYLQ